MMQNSKLREKVRWFYNGVAYKTRREITEKFEWSTRIWNEKLALGEIKKLLIKNKFEDTSNEEYKTTNSDAKQHSESLK